MDKIILTPDYWDCACPNKEGDFNYIHSIKFGRCPKCGVTKDEQPESRVNEVIAMLKAKREYVRINAPYHLVKILTNEITRLEQQAKEAL